MKKNKTMTLSEVRRLLRKSDSGKIINRSGWGVFQDAAGNQVYIFDDSSNPVDFNKVASFAQKRRPLGSALLAISNDFV